jgi:hypothetical protein
MQFSLPSLTKTSEEKTGAKRSRGVEGGDSQGSNHPRPGQADLQRRVERLEKLILLHDDQLRDYEAYTTQVWLMEPDCELGMLLLAKMREWQEARPSQGAHPWGPPRRGLALELVNWLLEACKESADGGEKNFCNFHKAMSSMEQLERDSVNLLMVKETHDGKTLMKIRPFRGADAVWAAVYNRITKKVEKTNGVRKFDRAPMGPLTREIKALVVQRAAAAQQ